MMTGVVDRYEGLLGLRPPAPWQGKGPGDAVRPADREPGGERQGHHDGGDALPHF